MKKVDEGVLLFDEIWEKVYSAEQQNQKEKYEGDLKKEIKKLQRLRDQIKSWIGSSDVKDKDALVDARRLIETKMEQFKICEKETKTKTYSKEGLARAEKLSPEEQAKIDCCKWVQDIVDQLNDLVDEKEVDIEKLSSGKGKKTNKSLIEDANETVANHKFHINKLEGIMRLVMNDRVPVDSVEEIKEDLDYYLEAHDDEDYMMGYDEEIFYEPLGLDELDVVNVDRVTNVSSSGKKTKEDDASSATSGSKKSAKASKKAATASSQMIPIKIGRARVTSSSGEKDQKTPTKLERAQSVPGPSLGPTPQARAPPPAPAGGASMAAILKRESEQREKERQQQQRLLEQQRQQEQLRQQQLQNQQEQMRQQEQLRQQQQAAQQKAAQQDALKRQQELQQQEAAKQQQIQQQQLQAQMQQQRSQQPIDGLLSSGLGGNAIGSAGGSSIGSGSAIAPQQSLGGGATLANGDATASFLGGLNESFLHMPNSMDSERPRTYTPRNPYPTPSSYPTTPAPIFESQAFFDKVGMDCLFFIFYYSQGSYQQFLAAKELKKQSWRFHKKYSTWFQRHEEPKMTTDEYEEGTYVYFDYETGWCQRIKSDFRFEYSYLEDSLQ